MVRRMRTVNARESMRALEVHVGMLSGCCESASAQWRVAASWKSPEKPSLSSCGAGLPRTLPRIPSQVRSADMKVASEGT